MIVLGIDPGTAALGYGIVESTAGGLREVDHGCLDDEPGPVAAGAAARDPRRSSTSCSRSHQPDVMARRAAVLLAQRPDGVRRRPGARRRAAGGGPARDARPRGDAERGQDRDRRATARPTRSRSSGWSSSCSGMSERPRPDDAADALAIAIWGANTARSGRRGRPSARGRSIGRPSRRSPRRDERLRAGRARGARRRTAATRAALRKRSALIASPMIASVEGVVGAIAADSLVIEVGGIGYRVFAAPAILAAATAGRAAQAPHVPPRARGPAGAVRLPDRRGARLLHAAADGQRGRTEGRARDRRLTAAADLQLAIMTQDQAVLVSIPGIGKKLAERIIFELKEKVTAAGVVVGPVGRRRRRERGRGRRRAPGARLFAGRGPRGLARGAAGRRGRPSLEERVKAALRSLLRRVAAGTSARWSSSPSSRPDADRPASSPWLGDGRRRSSGLCSRPGAGGVAPRLFAVLMLAAGQLVFALRPGDGDVPPERRIAVQREDTAASRPRSWPRSSPGPGRWRPPGSGRARSCCADRGRGAGRDETITATSPIADVASRRDCRGRSWEPAEVVVHGRFSLLRPRTEVDVTT